MNLLIVFIVNSIHDLTGTGYCMVNVIILNQKHFI